MKLDNFYVMGVSHMSEGDGNFTRRGLKSIAETLYEEEKAWGYAEMTTCLREEVYIHMKEEELLKKAVDGTGAFLYKGMEAVEYLFRVVCGLDSVIKGEDQILSQIRKAYRESVEEKRNSKILNTIFHRGIELGKKFRSESKIAENALSLEAISVKFLREKAETLKDKSVLILGAGELSQDILNILQKEETREIALVNRTMSRALEVQEKYNVSKVEEFQKRYDIIKEADIIIGTTSSPDTVIDREILEEMGLLEDKERIYLDLAVPRDIDESIGEEGRSQVHNIDEVWDVYRRNVKNRDKAVEDYLYLLEKQKDVLLKWFRYREELEKAC